MMVLKAAATLCVLAIAVGAGWMSAHNGDRSTRCWVAILAGIGILAIWA